MCAALLTAMLFWGTVAVAQTSTEQADLSSEGVSVFSETDESILPISTPTGETNVSGTRTVGGVRAFFSILLILAAVVALIWLLFRLVRRGVGSPEADDDVFLRHVSSVSLGAGKSVHIVTLVDDSAYILGVSDSSVQVISKIEDKELINAMNLYADKNGSASRPKNFSDILNLFMPQKGRARATKKQENVFEDGVSGQIFDSFKRQANRLREEE